MAKKKKREKKLPTKELYASLGDAEATMDQLLSEREKYRPTHLAYDRIQTRINAFFAGYVRIDLELAKKRQERILLYLLLISLSILFSFFQKPKLLFELSLNITLFLALIGGAGVLLAPIIHGRITREDRKARREHDYASAKYLVSERKRVEKELKKDK